MTLLLSREDPLCPHESYTATDIANQQIGDLICLLIGRSQTDI